MGDGYRASRDSDLHEGYVHQEQTEAELEQERNVAPHVVQTMLSEGQVSCSADDMISNLK